MYMQLQVYTVTFLHCIFPQFVNNTLSIAIHRDGGLPYIQVGCLIKVRLSGLSVATLIFGIELEI